jgi:hypothetical protein
MPHKLSTPQMRKQKLINDLEQTFNVRSKVAARKIPAYKLVVADFKKVKKLKSKGGQPSVVPSTNGVGLVFTNLSSHDFLRRAQLWLGLRAGYNYSADETPEIIDATNVSFNIDVELDADQNDWKETVAFLRSLGFDMVKTETLKDCIVISDNY